MSVPSNSNVSLKIFEKLRKYKDLEIEFTKVWHLKITTLPVVTGALSMVAKPAPNYVSQIPRAPSLTELQKTTLMGTAHILPKVLSITTRLLIFEFFAEPPLSLSYLDPC